ncbi:MAG TPA: class I SAM-dependent methyltransferase [Microthrixaceae bacterium]|nr:class I SAM-dependent methyltransferase [Microthrixaceae bacterium]
MTGRWSSSDTPKGAQYDQRFDRLAAAGHDIHGEASLVAGYGPRTVLDAGCGTGRVAIELARRGLGVVGVDNDAEMLTAARTKAPDLDWVRADLSTLDLRDEADRRLRFDAIVAAGNVMIFVEPGTEALVVARLAEHLRPGGLLISGFQLVPRRVALVEYDEYCIAAGLQPFERFGTWARDPWVHDGGYAVSVHQRPLNPSVPASRRP